MAEYTYTVTVASGNLYGGGTGNVFYLNGVRNSTGPGTVSWVEGGTLRFDQSEGTNDNHPLIFSTTTSKDQYLTSGVTYYLDGASNYANYTNTTTFNAATTRYVEVTPASATDFYYLCYVHGIGMGGIFDIESNVWGGLSWGSGVWGDQGHVDISATGISLTSSIGTLESITANADVDATGSQIASSQGTSVGGSSVSVSVTGISQSISVNQTITGIGAIITGSSLSSSVGAATIDESSLTGAGWGRANWNEFAWGVNYSVALTGQSLTSSIGEEAGITDVTVSVTGQSLTSTQGIISLVGDFGTIVNAAEDQLDLTLASVTTTANAKAEPSGISLSGSIGQVVPEPKFVAEVTGIQATFTLGTIALEQTTTESVTGQTITMSLGEEEQANVYPVTGTTMTGSIGSVTVIGEAGIDVSGIQLSASAGSPVITAWQEIDLGVSNTWTVVDLAA